MSEEKKVTQRPATDGAIRFEPAVVLNAGETLDVRVRA